MRLASKRYKSTLDKAYTDYQYKAANELRKISKSNNKAKWKILNKLNDFAKKDKYSEISFRALYDNFKNLNEYEPSGDDFKPDFDYNDIPDEVKNFLNLPITESEIECVVSNLKKNKSSGNDEIWV